jgi:hypothetical protein
MGGLFMRVYLQIKNLKGVRDFSTEFTRPLKTNYLQMKNKMLLQDGRKKILLLKQSNVFLFLFVLFLVTSLEAHSNTLLTPTKCKTPLVGKDRVINYIPGNLIDNTTSLTAQANNLLDENVNNALRFRATAKNSTLIAIKDIKNYYPAGIRAGFVVRNPRSGTPFPTDFRNGVVIVTYRNDVQQESFTGSGLTLSDDRLGAHSNPWPQRISITTTKEFDEIRLLSNDSFKDYSNGNNAIDVFYAFVEPTTGCPTECALSTGPIKPVTTTNYSGATGSISAGGLCLFCTSSGGGNLANTSTSDYASFSLDVGLGNSATVTVKAGTTINAGSKAGFVLTLGTGLLLSSFTSGTTIQTYLNGTQQESVALSGASEGSNNAYSFTTTKNFDEIRLAVSSLASSIGVSMNIYYAFVREPVMLDTDSDGAPDCIDKCSGNPDYMDADGDGIPNACDVTCTLNLGADQALCAQETSFNFNRSGLTWSILSDSPTGATVSSTGNVTGMETPGIYQIRATGTNSCTSTVKITRNYNTALSACGNPLVGSTVKVIDPSNGSCLICSSGGANVIDSDLSNYSETTSLSSVTSSRPIIGVQDSSTAYPSGSRTGFVVQPSGGLINATVLSNLSLRTYLNGVLQETVSGNSLALSASQSSSAQNQQRLSMVTTKPFNGVALYINAGISAITALKVYYAFVEPSADCPDVSATNCVLPIISESNYNARFNIVRTQVPTTTCTACQLSNLSKMVDTDQTNYATITQTVNATTPPSSSVSLQIDGTIGTDYQVGFILSSSSNLLLANVLQYITLTTYNSGTQVNSYAANNALVGSKVVDQSSGKIMLYFKPTAAFNEIVLTVSAAVSSLASVNVFGAFAQRDTDGDGVPDCMDKCCSANDNLVAGTDGIPQACNLVVTDNASCTQCPVTVTLSGPAYSAGNTYLLFEKDQNKGTFSNGTISHTPTASGTHLYTVRQEKGTGNYVPTKNFRTRIHPSKAQWKPPTTDNVVWKDSTNWKKNDSQDTGSGDFPIWCTDVTIPANSITYPILVAGDQCRDIRFEHCTSIDNPQLLKYRHAYVDFSPERNRWVMTTAPLKYMYSADYHADYSWTNSISPNMFMRYFDEKYATANKNNPDGTAGTSIGSFSRAFSNLKEALPAAFGFALWVNGAPYDNANFPDTASYHFPRRKSDGSDVQYSYHTKDGYWYGEPFYLSNRGNDISKEGEWTATSVPDKNNRYRFAFEDLLDENHEFTVSVDAGTTVLIGNPFLSYLDFARFYSDNSSVIHNYFRIWDGDKFYLYIQGDETEYWTALDGLSTQDDVTISPYISPLQSFFVETKGSGSVELTFSCAICVNIHSTTTFRSEAAEQDYNILRLYVKDQKERKNNTLLAIMPQASDGYDPQEDIYKLFAPDSTYPEIYTIADNTAIEMNAVSSQPEQQLIPLGIKSNQVGLLELGVSGTDALSEYTDAFLLDLQEDKRYELRNTPAITFDKTDSLNIEGRFYLSLEKSIPTAVSSGAVKQDVQVFVKGNTLVISSPQELIKETTLYDASGIMFSHQTQLNKNYHTIALPEDKRIFILEVHTNTQSKQFKLLN